MKKLHAPDYLHIVNMQILWLMAAWDTGGEVKKWGKMPSKHGIFPSWWGILTFFHA
jgi:hypothetical protein